jgi:PAS domain S-box-containing protein
MFANILGNSFQYEVLSVVPYPMLVVGKTGEILYMNECASQFYEQLYKGETITRISSIIESAYMQQWEEQVRQVVRLRETAEMNLAFFDYPSKIYRVSITPYYIHSEVIIGVMVHKENRTFTFKKKLDGGNHAILKQELTNLKSERENMLKLQTAVTVKLQKEGNDFIISFIAGSLLQDLGIVPQRVMGESFRLVFAHYPEKIAEKLTIYNRAWNGENMVYEDGFNGISYLASIAPIYKEGIVCELLLSIVDITSLKQSQNKLQESEQKYRSLLQYHPENVCLFDLEGNMVEINPEVERLLQKPKRLLLGTSFTDYLDRRDVVMAYEEFVETTKGEPRKFQIRVPKEDNSVTYLEVTSIPMYMNGILKGVYGVARDITKKKEMEQELIATKNLLESFIENTSDAIMLTSKKGCILRVNQAFENLYGWRKDEVVGKDILKIFHDFKDEVKMLFQGVQDGEMFRNVDTIRRRLDGTPLYVSITASPIKNGEGDIYGVSSIVRDITDRKQTEELLRRSEKLAVIGQLAAGVAHEIRNPLTSLKGFLQLFHEMKMTSDDILQVMMDEINRIEMITNEFLSLAKPHVTKFDYYPINDIMGQVVKLGEIEGGVSNIMIETQFHPCSPVIFGDANKLKQVFLNIIKNSIEAVGQKGVITISTSLKEECVSISIADNGVGIEENRLKYVGEPFYSTKEKGTGLGLMVSRKIIEEHKGEMVITSEIENGTTVEIKLPGCSALKW